MIVDILFLILAAGVPYYIFLEKSDKFNSRQIFEISALVLLGASLLSLFVENTHATPFVLIALASALFSVYRATKTTNFYKLGYYLIFVNAPFFILFEGSGTFYGIALLVSLFGIYLIGRFYEKHYGSANYHFIRGATLQTPCVGTYLTLYLIALALYPPFPNALFFLNYILKSDLSLLWYVVAIMLFFGNFFLAMRVMKMTLFGRPNPNIHYVHLTSTDKIYHNIVIVVLLILSIFGLREVLL